MRQICSYWYMIVCGRFKCWYHPGQAVVHLHSTHSFYILFLNLSLPWTTHPAFKTCLKSKAITKYGQNIFFQCTCNIEKDIDSSCYINNCFLPRAQTFVVTRTFSLPSLKRSMTAALCSTCISPLSSATWWPSLESSPASQPAVFLVYITQKWSVDTVATVNKVFHRNGTWLTGRVSL